MSLSDPIADMLTRIRNGLRIRSKQVDVKASKICHAIAAVLKQEGFIEDFVRIEDGKQGILKITLRYDAEGNPVISEINRTSKPGRRIYSSVDELPRILGGMGISIISTSKGVVSDKECRKMNISGEILCTVS